MDVGRQFLISKLKLELRTRGGEGYHALQRKFRIMDDDGSNSLSLAEFMKAMKEMSIGLPQFSDGDLRNLFGGFDVDKSGSISFEEFLQGVRDPLSQRRLDLVLQAFGVLDTDGSGIVEYQEVASKYNASMHPEVLQGRKTAAQVLREWMTVFGSAADSGKITQHEFINYYTNISASIDNEDYFELMIRNAWHISGGVGAAANSANRRVLVTKADGSQEVVEIKHDLGLKADDKAGMMARLAAQGSSASSISLYDGGSDGVGNKAPVGQQSFAAAGTTRRGGLDSMRSSLGGSLPVPPSQSQLQAQQLYKGNASSISLADKVVDEDSQQTAMARTGRRTAGKAHMSSIQVVGTFGTPDTPATPSSPSKSKGPVPLSSLAAAASRGGRSVPELLADLLASLATRGARGIIGLSRKFKIIDDNGNGVLSLPEFKKAMRECALTLTEEELIALFHYFDADHNGGVDFEEFMSALKGPMSQRRINLVDQAFDVMDTDGSGETTPDDLMATYSAAKHPDVISGKRTPAEVLREFLDTFDVGGTKDGIVTRQEFRNYYHNISASIDNEDYFELMIRNAWHISGGVGAAANSANRRVLVTKADGSQEVVEIKHDLGLKADDKAGMMARLAAQGSSASSISLYDGGSDGVGNKLPPPPPTGVQPALSNNRRTFKNSNASSIQF